MPQYVQILRLCLRKRLAGNYFVCYCLRRKEDEKNLEEFHENIFLTNKNCAS